MPGLAAGEARPGGGQPFFARMGMKEFIGLTAMVLLFGWFAWPFIMAWLAYAVKRRGLSPADLFGNTRFREVDWQPLWIVPFATMFTTGAVWLVYLPLSHWKPDFVERWLNQSFAAGQLMSQMNPLPAILLIVLILPVVEELAFRGLILRKLALVKGRFWAMCGSSLLFALLHGEWLGHFVLGVVCCLLYFRGGLWLAIAGHILNNLLAMIAVLAESGSYGVAQGFYALSSFHADWWIGALSLLVSVPALLYFIVRHGSAESRAAAVD